MSTVLLNIPDKAIIDNLIKQREAQETRIKELENDRERLRGRIAVLRRGLSDIEIEEIRRLDLDREKSKPFCIAFDTLKRDDVHFSEALCGI